MILRRLQAEGFKHLRGIDILFPPKGTFLIQGGNEAGKSSLFEVVFFTLFARPLQVRSSEELIGYGLNEAKTYLELEVAGNILRIERIIRRNKVNAVKLMIGEELITTSREASRRIQQELHLDAETLLNSCFVEQKALEKLEGLDKSSRESAVMKLLNLERMQAIEEELRVKREDEKRLEEWKIKKRIAEIKEEIPLLKKEIEDYERLRRFREVENLSKEAEANRKLAEEEEKKLPSLEEIRNSLQKQVQELHKLRDKEHKVDNLLSSIRFLREKEAHLDSLNKQLGEIEEARNSLPKLESRRQKAQMLLHLHSRLKFLTEQIEKAKEWLGLKKQIAEEESQMAVLNAEIEAKVEQLEKKKENIEILKNWRNLKEKEEKIKRKEKLSDEIGRLTVRTFVAFATMVLLLLFLLSPVKLLSATAVLPFICVLVSLNRKKNLQIEVARLSGEIGSADREVLRNLEINLVEKGLSGPQSREEGEQLLRKEEEELKFLQEGLEKRRNDVVRVQERIEILGKRLVSEFPYIYSTVPEENVAQRQEKMKSLLIKWEKRLGEVADQFKLPIEEEELKVTKNNLDSEIKHIQRVVSQEEELRGEKGNVEKAIEKMRSEIEKAAIVLEEKIKDIFSREEWENVRADLKRQRDLLEKEEVERKLQEAIGMLKAQEQKVKSYIERGEELEKRAQQMLSELGERPEHLPSSEEINSILDDKRAELRHREKELETLLGQVIGDIPPLEQCRMEYEKLERELKVRDLSATILEVARQNITKKILPRTVERMWSILPLITNDRYRQVELSEENFKIRVYDERAGDWKDKNIFSGGTRDQMSLALRLAFALAALPEERGTAPRFLFLDEPLSSFDEQRREALIRVITEGEIAEAFDQILVISHTPLLNPNLFHYYIVMENGRIKECSEELIPPEKRGFPLL